MRKAYLWGFSVLILALGVASAAHRLAAADYDKTPRFELPAAMAVAGPQKAFHPKNSYNIFINYELGMHCVGFDISYCWVIPPYNSIQHRLPVKGLVKKYPYNRARQVVIQGWR